MLNETLLRKPSKKVAAYAGAFVAFALFATGCSSSPTTEAGIEDDCTPVAEVETITPGTLKVLEVEHPPFVTMEGGSLTGVEGELVQKIAADLCLELDVQVTSFAAAIEGLQNNRGDLSSANWTVNDERRELFEVSDPMYMSRMGIVTQGEDWNTVDSLEGKKIGTPQGYLWNEQLIDIYGKNVVEYQSDVAVMDDVKAGRLGAGIINNHANSWRIATQDQYKDLTLQTMTPDERLPHTQNDALAVVLIKKGSTDLKDAVNTVLEDYKSSGAMEDWFNNYGLDSQFIVSGS